MSTAAVACATAYSGFFVLFSATTFYDDPGYMLSLIKGFNEHGHLYQAIFSQYGPFYSEFYYFLCRILGVPATHDGIRWVVLVLWIFSSIAGAIFAFRLTGRIWVAIMTQLLCFHVLNMLAWEPGHPLSLVVACFGSLILCFSGRKSEQTGVWQPITIGVCLGALLMIKINLGLFALAAVGTAWIYHSPSDVRGKVARYAAAFLFSIPLLLLKKGWSIEVRIYFGVLFICSLLSVLICFRGQTLDWRVLSRFGSWLLTGLLLTCGLSLLGALLAGSAWTDLVDGMITTPMRLGEIFTSLPSIGPLAATAALIGLLLAVTWRFFAERLRIDQGRFAFGLRLFFLTDVLVWLATPGDYFSLVLPFCWIAVLPLNSDMRNSNMPAWQFAQLSVALLAVGQVLGLYPVSGAQMSVPVYLGSVCVMFVVSGLLVDVKTSKRNFLPLWRVSATAVTIGLAIVVVGLSWRVTYPAASRYYHFSSLNLPGAQLLRIDESSAATYRFLVENLRDCRPSFLTIPGINSLYGWSEQEPPTGFNTTMNFALLSLDQQRAMVDVGRSCQPIAAVFNRQIFNFWIRGKFRPSGPLIDFLLRECRPVGRVKNYELMVLLHSPPPTLTSCVTLDQEWRTDAPANQITVFLPANFGTITNASLLHASSLRTTRHRMEATITSDDLETIGNPPTSAPRQFSFNLEGPGNLSRDSLDQMVIQLTDESAHIINLPFLRPPDRRDFQ